MKRQMLLFTKLNDRVNHTLFGKMRDTPSIHYSKSMLSTIWFWRSIDSSLPGPIAYNMYITDPKIDRYCQNMSTLPSPDCERIFEFTTKNVPMAMMLIGPLQGSFIGWLVRITNSKRVLEVGTFTGYSALCMAEQTPSDGNILTLDIDAETSKIAKKFWAESRHGSKIEQIVAPALETLKTLKGPFDFIFIDADKSNYPHYFDRALELLAPGGMIALDNSLRDGKVLNLVDQMDEGTRAIYELSKKIADRKDLKACLVPIRDGLMLVQRA